jgi:hypothetical protein
VAAALLSLWGAWWTKNLHRNRLLAAQHTQVPAWRFLALDFLNNYHGVRLWLAGGDPYHDPFPDPVGRKYYYPPTVLWLFVWCKYCTPRTATVICILAIIALGVFGVSVSCRARRLLGLKTVSFPLAVAAFFFTTPFLYALERGNYDLILVPLLLITVYGLKRPSMSGDLLAGSSLAFAVAIKLYPALLCVALLPLRRFRAILCSGLLLIALIACQYQGMMSFRQNIQELISHHIPIPETPMNPAAHSLSGDWLLFWTGTRFAWLGKIPGTVAALALLVPPVVWLGSRVQPSRRAPDLLYPYLLWTLAAATFVPYIANDYSLVFLPLAALAVWGERNSVRVQMGMTLMVLCLQPLNLAIGAKLLMVFKCLALTAVAAAVAERCSGLVLNKNLPPYPAALRRNEFA